MIVTPHLPFFLLLQSTSITVFTLDGEEWLQRRFPLIFSSCGSKWRIIKLGVGSGEDGGGSGVVRLCRTRFSEHRQKSLFIRSTVSSRPALWPNTEVRQHTSSQLFLTIPVSFGRGRPFCGSWLQQKAAPETEVCSSTTPTPAQPETPLGVRRCICPVSVLTQNKTGSGFWRSFYSWFQSQGPLIFSSK